MKPTLKNRLTLLLIACSVAVGCTADTSMPSNPSAHDPAPPAPAPVRDSSAPAATAPPGSRPVPKKATLKPAAFVTASAQGDSVNAVLRPPKGAQVAIVVFEDLQCPQCRRVAPILAQAAKTYKIPLVRHDFPLPMHNWSYEAAVMARYFDATSKELGNQFRDYIFSNQLEINPQNLRGYADKFASEHKVGFPFVIDPQGKFAAEVNADRDIGKAIKLDHTPTIYIVSDRHPEKPYVEVEPRQIDQQLYSLIDAMMKN